MIDRTRANASENAVSSKKSCRPSDSAAGHVLQNVSAKGGAIFV